VGSSASHNSVGLNFLPMQSDSRFRGAQWQCSRHVTRLRERGTRVRASVGCFVRTTAVRGDRAQPVSGCGGSYPVQGHSVGHQHGEDGGQEEQR
jgi:hypothetical protein